MSSFPHRFPALPALFCLWAILNLPYLGYLEFHQEEGRRALTALEMCRSGEWLIPTVLEHTYLNKPPGFTWILTAFAGVMGGVHEWSVRLPSALASLSTALLIFFFDRRRLALTARFLAAAIYLLTFFILEKSRSGELEAVFIAQVWAALWLWWHARHSPSSPHLYWLCGAMLAAALLTKGPPALIFFYGTLGAFYLWKREERWFLSRQHGRILAAMLILCLAWVIPLLLRLGMDAPLAVWGEQLARREPGSEASTFYSRLEFLLNAFFGFFPGILLWLPLLSRRFRSRLSLDADFLCFALGGFLIPALFFFLFPNSRPRYLAPSVPMVALPAGVVGSVLLAGESLPSAASLLRWSGRFFSLAALVGGTILAGRFWDAPYPLFPHGFAWSLLLLPFAAVALVFDRRRSAPVVSACLMLFLLCAVEIFLAKDTVKQHQRLHSRQTADRILEEIGEAEVLYTRFRNDFNIFYYVMRSGKRVIYVESLEEIPADTPQYVISIFPIQEEEYPQGEALRLRTLTKETGHPAYLHRIVQQIP